MEARKWRPGESGNPSGRSGLFQEMQRRAREATPELIGYLLEIARDGGEDARNRIVAITIMLERGWGKVPISEPATLVEDAAKPRLADIVDRWTPEQRALARQLFAVNGKTVAEVNAEPAPGSDSSAAAAGE
jgi:hypothetical protein